MDLCAISVSLCLCGFSFSSKEEPVHFFLLALPVHHDQKIIREKAIDPPIAFVTELDGQATRLLPCGVADAVEILFAANVNFSIRQCRSRKYRFTQ